MSDDAILADEDPREFHSPFDIALDWAALEAFKWLVLGHIAYVAGLAVGFGTRLGGGCTSGHGVGPGSVRVIRDIFNGLPG